VANAYNSIFPFALIYSKQMLAIKVMYGCAQKLKKINGVFL